MSQLEVLSDYKSLDILIALAKRPMWLREIARTVNISTATAFFRVRELEKAGFIRTYKEAGKLYSELTELGLKIVSSLPLSEFKSEIYYCFDCKKEYKSREEMISEHKLGSANISHDFSTYKRADFIEIGNVIRVLADKNYIIKSQYEIEYFYIEKYTFITINTRQSTYHFYIDKKRWTY